MEPVEIELEEALVHGQTEVTFSYEEVEYTAELTEAYVDPEVEAEEKLAAATDAVKVAEESLLGADLAAAQELVTALEASDAKTLLQARINSVQLQIQGIIAAVNNANTEVKFYNALNQKPFVNVDVELISDMGSVNGYATQLGAAPRNFTTIAAIQTIIDTVNANAVNTDITTLVNNADTAVQAAETDPTGLVGTTTVTKVDAAQEKIDKLPTEIPEAVATALSVNVTVKADLQERLEAVKVVVPVLEATNQIQLLAALQNKAFDRVNEDLIATYETDLDGSQKTVVAIQGAIDATNLLAAQNAVTAAETAPLTAEKVATAQALVNYLPDLDPNTVKDGLQEDLDVVTALIAVADATTEAELLTALENEVLGLTDVNPAAIAEYKEEIDTNSADITTATNVQSNVISVGNTAAETAAVTAIKTNFPTYDETDAADQAKALKELNRLADVSDLDKETIDVELIEQYILAIAADLAGTSTIDGTDDPAAIRALINGANAVKEETLRLAAVNAATSARSTFLTNVNAATSISTMVTALNVVEFPEFKALGALEQVEVAELVYNALQELKAKDPVEKFETIAEIKAAAGL